MARNTPNKGLKVWDLPNDDFNPADLAFNWDALDTALAPVVYPGTQISITTFTTDTTTTTTADPPGATLFAFPAATYTNTTHYLHIMIPRLAHTVANSQARFRLREGGSDVVGLIAVYCHATASATVNVNILAPFTPTAGSHSYTVTWSTGTAGTLTIGATGLSPAIIRTIKA